MARAYPTVSQLRFLIWLKETYPKEIDASIKNVIGGSGYAVPDGISRTEPHLFFRQVRLNEVRDTYLNEYINHIKECSNT